MNNIENIIYDETKKRLDIMDSKEYVYPSKIGKIDIFFIILLIFINLIFIILCMLGVIV